MAFGGPKHNHDLPGSCSRPDLVHVRGINIHRVLVVFHAVIVYHVCLVAKDERWVAGNPELGEGNDFSPVGSCLGDKSTCLLSGRIDVEPE